MSDFKRALFEVEQYFNVGKQAVACIPCARGADRGPALWCLLRLLSGEGTWSCLPACSHTCLPR